MVMAVSYTSQQLIQERLEYARLQPAFAHVQVLLEILPTAAVRVRNDDMISFK
jgi:hypothetical protein